MIRPQPCSHMSSITCLVTLNRLVRLVSITSCQSLRLILRNMAVAGDAGVVDEDVDGAVFGLDALERGDGRIPVADVADRSPEVVAERGLLGDPPGVVAVRAAAGDHGETVLVQTLAHRGADPAHASGHIGQLAGHPLLQLVRQQKRDSGRSRCRSGVRRSGPAGPRNSALDGQGHAHAAADAQRSDALAWRRGAASHATTRPGSGSRTHRSGARSRSRRR